MNNTQDQEHIKQAEDVLSSYRQGSDKVVFETSCRDDFVLVSKALHTQRMQLIEEFSLTGKVTQPSLAREFGVVASVLKYNEEYKAEIADTLTGFWREYEKASEIHVVKDTTEYWDKKFRLFGDSSDSGALSCLNDVMEDIAHTHIEITGHTREEDDILASSMYTTECLTKAKHRPAHSFAVTNQSWLQDGTVLTKADDLTPIYRPSAGDMLFMPAQTFHEPPELEVNSDGSYKPRFMFVAEMRNLEATF